MAGRAKVRNPEAGGALEHDRAVLATSRHLKAHRHMRHALEENEDDFDVQFSMAASLAGGRLAPKKAASRLISPGRSRCSSS